MRRWLLALVVGLVTLGTALSGQGTLSEQVLRLLTQPNTWPATQTFVDLRVPLIAIPSDTAARLYADPSGNLYFNNALIAGTGGTPGMHNLLSSTHPDTTPASVVRGDLLTGQGGTPKWTRFPLCAAGSFIGSNGTDVICSTSGASITGIALAATATALATARAINGVSFDGTAAITVPAAAGSLTGATLAANVLASSLTSVGTLASLTVTAPITGSLAGSAATLTTARAINGVNFDGSAAITVPAAAGTLTGSSLAAGVTGSSLTGLGTLTSGATGAGFTLAVGTSTISGIVPAANLGTNTPNSTKYLRGDGAWIVGGAGTVTSVAFSAPGVFSISGSPITTTGTLALSLATESANMVWAGPTSGAAAGPTFRSLVTADFPSIITPGTYPKVTIDATGRATAGAAAITLTAGADVTGTLPIGNGGTGVASASDDTVLVSNGTIWQAKTIPDCQTAALTYTQSTNSFGCPATGGPTHTLLSAIHTDTTVGTVVRGDMIVGSATPTWNRVALGGAGTIWAHASGSDPAWTNQITLATTLYASLGTPANGTFAYCSDCAVASPCAGAGSGALAKRLNGAWVCN